MATNTIDLTAGSDDDTSTLILPLLIKRPLAVKETRCADEDGGPSAGKRAKAETSMSSLLDPFRDHKRCFPELAARTFYQLLKTRPNSSQQSLVGFLSASARPISAATQLLPPGVVLLRNFLSKEQQHRVIELADELHVETPFFIKEYTTGSMHLLQLSMGLHWSATGPNVHQGYVKSVDFSYLFIVANICYCSSLQI